MFGLPGGPMDHLLSIIPKTIEWTNTGNELQNGFCAQAYGHYTQNVGYLFTTTGPGFATAISALEQAIYEGNPLVLVSTVSTYKEGDFQNWSVKEVSKHLTKHYYYVNSKQDMFKMVQESYEVAQQLCTGVILLIEQSLITEPMNRIQPFLIPSIPYISSHVFTPFHGMKTLVVVGKLKGTCYREVLSFIQKNQLPYVTTWKCRFKIKEYAHNCGRLGTLGNHSANYALRHASHVIVLGNVSSQLCSPTKERFSLPYTDAYILSICYQPIALGTVYSVNQLRFPEIHIRPNPAWLSQLQHSNKHLYFDLPRLSSLERYAYIAATIYKQHKLSIPVCTDVGNHWYAIGKYMDLHEPNLFESTTTWASIGIGMASSIGIHYALKCPVWTFMGDGGTLFGASDLMYLLNYPQLPITVTIYVNHIYGAIFEDIQFKHDNEKSLIISVPTISILKHLPNCHYFKDEMSYATYLSNHCISHSLRFIILSIPNPSESYVYEIQADTTYEQHILQDQFQEILNTPMIIY